MLHWMPTDDTGFWKESQAAARFKHYVVRNQLGAFTGKTGSRAADHRVVFLDGYAGPGTYDSGQPGSPQIAADVASALAGMADLAGFFIERRPKHARRLRRLLDEQGFTDWVVHEGTCQDRLPEVLVEAGESPLLVFLDPYGLGIPFDMLLNQVLARPVRNRYSRARKTEVILHFSIAALNRMGGFLDKDYAATPEEHNDHDDEQRQLWLLDDLDDEDPPPRHPLDPEWVARREQQQQQALRGMDDFLGGPWWREVKRSNDLQWPALVLRQWIRKVREHTRGRWKLFPVPVPNVWDGPPAYFLVLLTQSNEGEWVFNEGVSRAYDRLYEETWVPPPSGTLFDDGTIQERPKLDAKYIDAIADNVRDFLARGGSGPVIDNLTSLYSEQLGRARSTHLYRALQRVHGEKLLEGDPPVSRTLKGYVLRPLAKG